jgi:predicted nucleic acid-binding protein
MEDRLGLRLRNSRLVELITFTNELEAATWRIFTHYLDKAWSYTDCASLALAQQCKLSQAFTFDHHFVQMGLSSAPSVSRSPDRCKIRPWRTLAPTSARNRGKKLFEK